MTKPLQDDPAALAQATAHAMWGRDHAAHALGMHLSLIAPGSATLTMSVRHDMLNGHNTCHGGMIFTLADTAFAYACNSHNHNTVASACHIDFLAPAREGDTLEAHAAEQSLSGRTGVYDVTVRDAATHKTIALFRGKSSRIQGTVIESMQDTEHSSKA